MPATARWKVSALFADGSFRSGDRSLALGDLVTDRRALEAAVLEGEPQDGRQDDEADGDAQHVVIRRLDGDVEDDRHADDRECAEQLEDARTQVPRARL